MSILRKNLGARSLINAAAVGLGLSVLFSLILMFAAAIGGLPDAGQAGESIGASGIVSTATAAVPDTDVFAATPSATAGSDGWLDEFRLHPDSCCINHY